MVVGNHTMMNVMGKKEQQRVHNQTDKAFVSGVEASGPNTAE